MNHDYKEAWSQFIQDKGPFQYHLTTTFNTKISDNIAYKSMMFYLHLLNQKIFGSRYKKKGLHIEGFIFAESHKDGTTHYHLLLEDNELFHVADKPSLQEHVNNSIVKVKLGNSNRQIISPVGVRLDEVYSSDIIEYTIKSMPSYGQDTARFIGVLGIDGTDRISPVKYR